MTNPIFGTLEQEVTQTRGVMKSATAFISGMEARHAEALAAALANGATEAELAPLIEWEAALRAEREPLAAAIAANPGPGDPVPSASARR